MSGSRSKEREQYPAFTCKVDVSTSGFSAEANTSTAKGCIVASSQRIEHYHFESKVFKKPSSDEPCEYLTPTWVISHNAGKDVHTSISNHGLLWEEQKNL